MRGRWREGEGGGKRRGEAKNQRRDRINGEMEGVKKKGREEERREQMEGREARKQTAG